MAGENPVKSFACTSCNAPITLRGMGQTSTVACPSCGAIIDITNENYRIIQKARQRVYQPLIPLGTRGKLGDKELEVIGFMERSDGTGFYRWDEYLLFNPYEGFFWLMDYHHHWTFIRPIKDSIPISGTGESSWVNYDEEAYQLFLTGIAKVQYVLGEFYWEVKVGDEVVVKDFICPPRMLSLEVAEGESVWSLGEHIEGSTVAEAFGIENYNPVPEGVGAVQPFAGAPWYREFNLIGILFLVLIIAIHMMCSASARSTPVFDQIYNFSSLEPNKTIVTEPFQIPKDGNLQISASAPVQNNWLSLDLDLVDESGEEIQGGELEVAYYTGVDSDGAWSEGSQHYSTLWGSVPAGTYRFSFSPSVGTNPGNLYYTLSARNNVPHHWLFAIALILVSLPLVTVWIWKSSWETRRWEESDP